MKQVPLESMIPSELCLKCDVCCRFPEADSPLAPFFTEEEVLSAVRAGLVDECFQGKPSGRIRLIPFPDEIESPGHNGGCLCPSFDPLTHRCAIYEVRPFDCQLYPFVLMKNEKDEAIVLGIDSKCPFIRDPLNRAQIRSYGKELLEILKSPPFQKMFRRYPELIGAYQADVTVLDQL